MQPDNLPADTTVVKHAGPWSIHLAPSTLSLYIETGDYHALPLQLSIEDLQELARAIEAARERVKQDVQGALQDYLQQMIADDPGKKILQGYRIELLPPDK